MLAWFSPLSMGGGAGLPRGRRLAVEPGSRTAAMGRSGMWIVGHLWPSASGGSTGLVTSGSRLAHPRFFHPMVAATAIGRFFRPGCARRGCEEAWPSSRRRRTSALPLKEGCHVAIWQRSLQSLRTGGIQEVEEWEGGPVFRHPPSPTPPPRRPYRSCAASWRRRRRRRARRLRLRRRVPLGPRPRVQREMPLGRRAPPGGWTVAGAITRSGWSIWAIWGCPPWRHL